MPVPLLETLVDGHPDVEVDLRLGDVVAGEELTQTGGVLLQHVAVVLPAPALREHLRQRRTTRSCQATPLQVSPAASHSPAAYPWVQVSHIATYSIFVGDLDVLVTAGVNHHVPGVAVQAVGPVVVALSKIGSLLICTQIVLCRKREREESTQAVIL